MKLLRLHTDYANGDRGCLMPTVGYCLSTRLSVCLLLACLRSTCMPVFHLPDYHDHRFLSQVIRKCQNKRLAYRSYYMTKDLLYTYRSYDCVQGFKNDFPLLLEWTPSPPGIPLKFSLSAWCIIIDVLALWSYYMHADYLNESLKESIKLTHINAVSVISRKFDSLFPRRSWCIQAGRTF